MAETTRAVRVSASPQASVTPCGMHGMSATAQSTTIGPARGGAVSVYTRAEGMLNSIATCTPPIFAQE